MPVYEGVHLKSGDKSYFIHDKALELFEQSDEVAKKLAEEKKPESVNLEAHRATHPDGDSYRRSQAATLGVQ